MTPALGARERDDHYTPTSDVAREHYLEGRSYLWGWDVEQDHELARESFTSSIEGLSTP